MRKLLTAIVVVVVLFVIALSLAPRFINVNRYHDRIQAELEQRLNRPVSLGNMRLRLLPPKFAVANAVIGEDRAFGTGRPFAQAQELDVKVKLLPLFRKQVELQSLRLRHPVVELVRDQQGVWNFASLGNRNVNGSTTPAPPSPPETKPPNQNKPSGQQANPGEQTRAGQQQNFELGKLEIADGSVAITDLQKHQSRAVYDHIDLTLKDFAPNKPFSVALAAHLPGQGKQVVQLNGQGGPINDAQLLNTPFGGKLKLQQVALSSAQKFLNTPALAGTDATISGEATVDNQHGQLASKGSLRLENTRVRGVDVGYPITADYDISDDLTSDVIHFGQTTVKLGNTPLALAGSVNTRSTPALADLNLRAGNVSIAEAARLASAFGVAFNPGMQVSGNVSMNVHAQGAFSSPSLNGSVTGTDLVATGKQFPAPVKVNSIALALSPQTIQSNNFTAASGGTAVNMQVALAQYTTANPFVDATVKTVNANIGELINIARAAGATSLDGASGSGVLSLDVHAKGPVKTPGAMEFAGSGQMQNASLRTAQMTAPLNVRNASLQFTQNSAVLQNLAASAGSTNANGNLTVRNFQAPQVQFALAADKVNVLELQKIFGAAPPAPQNGPQQKRASSDLEPQAYAQSAPKADPPAAPKAAPSILTKTTGTGTVSIGTLTHDQLVLNNVKSNVTLNNGVINLNPLTSQLYGGTEAGSITADLRPAQPVFNLNLKMQKVDSNQLLTSVSSIKDTLYGLLNAATQSLSFALTPNASDITKTLNGRLSINLTNGKLTKVDVLQQIANVGKFQSLGRSPNNFTNIQQLSGDFDIRNGVATTNDTKAEIDGGTLAANGSVNLVSQALDMRVTAVLSKGMSQTAGGTSVGGFMQTALANNNGELVVPLLVTGTFQDMHFAPDMQQMAQMKMKNLLPSFSNPGQLSTGALTGKGAQGQGGIGGIVGGLAGGQQNQQAAPNSAAQPANPNSQQNAVDNALGGLLGGGKKKSK